MRTYKLMFDDLHGAGWLVTRTDSNGAAAPSLFFLDFGTSLSTSC
jgi:hypothetical protein